MITYQIYGFSGNTMEELVDLVSSISSIHDVAIKVVVTKQQLNKICNPSTVNVYISDSKESNTLSYPEGVSLIGPNNIRIDLVIDKTK